MSGAIRTALGQVRRYARTHLDKYKALLLQNPSPWNIDAMPLFAATLEVFKNDLKKFEKNFEKWQEVLDMMEDDADRKAEQDLFDEAYNSAENGDLIDELETVVATINSHLERTVPVPVVVQPAPPTSELNAVATHSHSQTIPTLDIPKFKGDYLKWSYFWQRFDHAVHQKSFPEVEKLISLLGLLDGRALEEVEGFQVSAENYNTVVTVLVNRFGNKQLILKELQMRLRSIQASDGSVNSLRSTVNAINNICLQLKNHGIDINNDSLKLDIIEKLPQAQKDELTWLSVVEPTKTTEDILLMMKQMALKAEICDTAKPQQPPTIQHSSNEHNFLNKIEHSSNDKSIAIPSNCFDSAKNDSQSLYDKKRYCIFCNKDHVPWACPHFKTVDSKLEHLRLNGFCTSCTGKNHEAKDCYSKVKCHHCNGNHQTFLCKSKTSSYSNEASTFVAVDKAQGTLLTKEVTVANPKSGYATKAVVLFDCGSQRSYISNELIKKLRLPKCHREKLNIRGFGGKLSIYNSALVEFQLETDGKPMIISANSSKTLASCVPLIENYDEKSKNFTVKEVPPDIILGMDYFLNIITSFEELNENTFIVHSKVGKIFTASQLKQSKNETLSTLAIDMCVIVQHNQKAATPSNFIKSPEVKKGLKSSDTEPGFTDEPPAKASGLKNYVQDRIKKKTFYCNRVQQTAKIVRDNFVFCDVNVKQKDTVSIWKTNAKPITSRQPCGGEGLFELNVKESNSLCKSNESACKPHESIYGNIVFINKPDRLPYSWRNAETCRQRKSRIIQRKIVSYAAKSLSPDRLNAPVKSVCFQQSTEESPPETSNSTMNDLISNV